MQNKARRAKSEISLDKQWKPYADVAAQFDAKANAGIELQSLSPGSRQQVWWRCPQGPDHLFEASPYSRTHGKGSCPCCRFRQLSVTNTLAALAPKAVLKTFDVKANGVKPTEIMAGGHQLYWWRCPVAPDHVWQTRISKRLAGHGCPACSGRQLSVTNSLATVSPQVAAELDPGLNSGITADQVIAGSHSNMTWRCSQDPTHIFSASPKNRTGPNRVGSCPFCIGRRLTDKSRLSVRFPQIAAELDTSLSGVSADEVSFSSNQILHWRCVAGHRWTASPNNRTRPSRPGCPECSLGQSSKIEVRIAHELSAFIDLDMSKSARLVRADGTVYRVDMVCPSRKLIIEFDGQYWHKGKEAADRAKSRALAKAGWTVVRAREGNLRVMNRHDVRVPFDDYLGATYRILDRIAKLYGDMDTKVITAYKELGTPIREVEADAYLARAFEEAQRRRERRASEIVIDARQPSPKKRPARQRARAA